MENTTETYLIQDILDVRKRNRDILDSRNSYREFLKSPEGKEAASASKLAYTNTIAIFRMMRPTNPGNKEPSQILYKTLLTVLAEYSAIRDPNERTLFLLAFYRVLINKTVLEGTINAPGYFVDVILSTISSYERGTPHEFNMLMENYTLFHTLHEFY